MAKGYIQIPRSISARTDLSPSHKLILGVLGTRQGDSASCFPAYEWIAEQSGLSRRQVVRVVNDLAARKEIMRLRIPYQSNTYSVPWATARAGRKKWAEKRKIA